MILKNKGKRYLNLIFSGINSYSQSGEDLIVDYIFRVLNIPSHTIRYLDLGANHYKRANNTFFFYKNGGQGVLVEANPKLSSKLKRRRFRDIVINKIVSTESGQQKDFFIMNSNGMSSVEINTINTSLQKNKNFSIKEKLSLDTIAVNKILADHFNKQIHLLSVDLEGHDLEVLKSIDFERYCPLIVIVETIDYDPKIQINKKNQSIMQYMESIGYLEYAFTGINSIFINHNKIK